jgi:hypothetical protein
MMYVATALISAKAGFLLGWFLKRYDKTQRAVVTGTGNYVNQSGAYANGDLIGGNKPNKQDKCKYCGG